MIVAFGAVLLGPLSRKRTNIGDRTEAINNIKQIGAMLIGVRHASMGNSRTTKRLWR